MSYAPIDRSRRVLGLLIGLGGIGLIALVAGPFDDPVTRATEALILILPVVAAAVVGGRTVAFITTAVAAFGFSMLIEPVGSPLIERREDLAALVAFLLVAVVVSFLVTRHIALFDRVENQRKVLLRSVSHDLRTPMAVIMGASSEMLDDQNALDDDTRRRMLQMVGDEMQRLDRLVENLLSLSRIEAGALRPERQAVDLREMVDVIVERLHRLFVDIRLEVDIADDVPTLELDHTLMDQVLTNLLENAARHSPTGGVVRLRARVVTDAVVQISVSDSGPGVDEADRQRIFEPFRSGPVAGASGIGLAICKAIVEAHGGTIRVGGEPGSGATFVITLVA